MFAMKPAPTQAAILPIATLFSACAVDPSPPDYFRVDVPDDVAASVLGAYLAFLPSDWARGSITISSCKGSGLAEHCDFFVEHRTRKCEFGAYMLYFAGDQYSPAHYKTIPDERAQSCFP